jgi:hypothetical protein
MKIGRFSRDGSVIADAIELEIAADYRRSDGREGWRGEAWLPTDAIIFPGDRLRLEFQTGEMEDVVIDRVTVDSKAGRMLVRFHPLQ